MTHTHQAQKHNSPPTRCEEEHYALTLAERPVVGGEGDPAVGGAEAVQTGAGVAANGVMADGRGATNFRSDRTLVFIWGPSVSSLQQLHSCISFSFFSTELIAGHVTHF